MKELYEGYDLLTVMLGIGIVTVILQSVAGWITGRLLEDCSQIAGTKNPWIRSLIGKFEICYQLRIPAKDVGGFLDRYLWEYRFGGIRLATWGSMGLYGAWLTGMYFGICTIIGIYSETTLRVYGLYCIYALVVISMIFGGELLLQLRARHKMVRVYLLDYLENTLQPRLENQYLHPEEQEEYQRAYFEETIPEPPLQHEEPEKSWKDSVAASANVSWHNPEKQQSPPDWVEKGLENVEKGMDAEERMELIGEIMEEFM
ncbi:MAG: hypothetical protein J1E62_02805 [Lachnospiraceae bacterium]|nr:hypothetical protein [Lachnospiraceae bacterium]